MSVGLAEIHRLIARRELRAALTALDALPQLTNFERQEQLRIKALVLSGLGMTEQALSTSEIALDSVHVRIEDFYFAGQYALELHNFRKALDYLSRAISASIKEGSDYYLSASYLLRAYILIQNGELVSARDDLDAITDEDCAVTWLSNTPRITKTDLLAATAPSGA
jgi:tetratricopeptide (TPR) repeat protein